MMCSFLQVNFWMIPAEKQIVLIRKALFKAILRQEISWFDLNKSGELQNRLNE
jgi:ABC-type multidrug transport system fused ATPase/permease subunit